MKTKYHFVFIVMSILFMFNIGKIEAHALQFPKEISWGTTYEIRAADLIKSSSKVVVGETIVPDGANILLLDTKRRNVISTPKENTN